MERNTFNITMHLTSCPADPKDFNKMIRIFPVGMRMGMTINLEKLCSCSCENENTANDRIKCTNHGKFTCGKCYCDQNYAGSKCECSELE